MALKKQNSDISTRSFARPLVLIGAGSYVHGLDEDGYLEALAGEAYAVQRDLETRGGGDAETVDDDLGAEAAVHVPGLHDVARSQVTAFGGVPLRRPARLTRVHDVGDEVRVFTAQLRSMAIILLCTAGGAVIAGLLIKMLWRAGL